MAEPDPKDVELVGKLIERLMTDPQLRADFRRNPAQACLDAGLPELAAELGGVGGKAMQTMELRESKSSLAGVVMAVAVEGISLLQADQLLKHGLPGMGKGGGAGPRPRMPRLPAMQPVPGMQHLHQGGRTGN